MKKILFSIIAITLVVNPYVVLADEFIIDGNGSGSDNVINAEVTAETTVNQKNDAQIENNVDVEADTGGNTANSNTGGEVVIDTGEINAEVNIINEGINESYVDLGCCAEENTIEISGNGSNSKNLVVYTNTSSSNVSIINNATITNNVTGYVNTGNNSANYNTGSVSIVTGNINATDNIKNSNVNVYQVDAANSGGSVSIRISDNGNDSDNSIVIINDNSVIISIKNIAVIENNSDWVLNTGGNQANGNNGTVKIVTGDIYFKSNITNDGINVGYVDVDCCNNTGGPIDPGKPIDPNPPVNPPSGGNGSSGGGGGSSSDNGSGYAAGGDVLPVTGPSNLIFLAIANILMFFMGWYLRLRSGNSPPNFA